MNTILGSICCAIVILLLQLTHRVKADDRYNCPNNGVPKLDESGKSIQCLPGQASDIVCGKGYSCFFSGFNYQCCPTAIEDELNSMEKQIEKECPQGSFAVLGLNGNPIKCNAKGEKCPQSEMFCNDGLCCERFDKKKLKNISKKQEKKLQEITINNNNNNKNNSSSKENIRYIVNRDIKEGISMECPRNTLMILKDDNTPQTCNENQKCPEAEMFCHKNTNDQDSFCCQEIDAKDELNMGSAESFTTAIKSNIKLEEAKKLLDELHLEETFEKIIQPSSNSAPTTTTLAPIQIPTTITTSLPAKTIIRFYVDNETNKTNGKIIAENNNSSEDVEKIKAKGVKNVNEDSKNLPIKLTKGSISSVSQEEIIDGKMATNIEYQPHSQGGYAVSKNLIKINSRKNSIPNQKLIAQQYLLEQIKEGWPYDEKFYRSDSVSVIRKNQHPTAIVHFQN